MLTLALTINAQNDYSSKEGVTKEPENMKNVDLAFNLIRYGYNNNSAISLSQAAQMLSELNLGQFTAKETTGTEKSEKALNTSVPKLLADAVQMAGDNQEALAYVNSVKSQIENKPIEKGARYGAVRKSARVAANSTASFTLDIVGGELMTIAIYGDGDTDLDLYVYNEIDELRAYDEDSSGDCLVMFVPIFSQTVRILVKNRGNIYNDFVIVTN